MVQPSRLHTQAGRLRHKGLRLEGNGRRTAVAEGFVVAGSAYGYGPRAAEVLIELSVLSS